MGPFLRLHGKRTWRPRLGAASGLRLAPWLQFEAVEVLFDLLEEVQQVTLHPVGRVLVPVELLVAEWLAALRRPKQALSFVLVNVLQASLFLGSHQPVAGILDGQQVPGCIPCSQARPRVIGKLLQEVFLGNAPQSRNH